MRYALFITFGLGFLSAQAQLEPIQHEDYNDWKRISDYETTHNGQWMAVETSPQEGDAILNLHHLETGEIKTFERATEPNFTPDNRWLFFTVKPAYDEIRRLKLKDTDKKDLPKNQFVRFNLESGIADTIPEMISYKFPEKRSGYVAVLVEPVKKEENEEDSTAVQKEEAPVEDFADAKEKDKHGDGFYKKDAKTLIIWNFHTNTRDTIERVTDYRWAENASVLAGIQSAGDSTQPAVFWRWSAEGETRIKTLQSAFEGIGTFSLSENGEHLSWLMTEDTAESDIRYFNLYGNSISEGVEVRLLLESRASDVAEGWMLSPNRDLHYADNNRSLYLGTAPIPKIFEEDTSILDEEKVKLDIWSWTDEYVQPMQKVRADRDLKKSYLGRFDFGDEAFVQLENESLPDVHIDYEHPAEWLLAEDDRAYRISSSWSYPWKSDYYVVHAKNGERKLLRRALAANMRLSPAGRYAFWFDGTTRDWRAIRLSDNQELILSANIPHPVWNEEHDAPSVPDAYGMAGWTNGDSAIVIYDAFDMWKVVPGGASVCLTDGMGRRENTRMRYVEMDREAQFLPSDFWKISMFDESDKSSGYAELDVRDREVEILIYGDFMFSTLAKADSAEVYFFRKQSIGLYPELYVVKGDNLARAKRLTHTNPQQGNFRWPSAELVHWTTPKGIELQGLLIKPEDFDPKKKYPVLVYFYETYSDLLHRYWSPAPSASVINFPYFSSHEYLIFIPDIVYETGHPGGSAEECVLSGVRKLAENPWVDVSRMAIQGQSWGGYQVAHLVTRTDMFRCAMAGAPVSNMTSAYGGIRWGSGMSRAFQYEKTQSRIGGTLWEERDLYIENSPVFFSDRVNTPLLMMHNDGDGAVPWYQGIEMFMALRRLNKPVWLLVYNGEEHNLMKRHNRKDLSIRMAQFFDHYLKDAPAPEWLSKGRKYIEKDDNPATGFQEE